MQSPLFAAGYPFFGINVATIGYYQSIERGRLATGLTVLRGIVLMAFCFLVLPRLAGVAGIWLAVPAAEPGPPPPPPSTSSYCCASTAG